MYRYLALRDSRKNKREQNGDAKTKFDVNYYDDYETQLETIFNPAVNWSSSAAFLDVV
jgi:hypothetical protein